jgi:hypothetical protein
MKNFFCRYLMTGLLILTLTACSALFPTQIDKILANPRDYADKKVTISGTVTDTFSFLVVKYFTVTDDTGEMTVVSQKPLPEEGSTVKVTGTVKEAFSLGDQRMIVLIER